MKYEHENNFTGEVLLFYIMIEFLLIDTVV